MAKGASLVAPGIGEITRFLVTNRTVRISKCEADVKDYSDQEVAENQLVIGGRAQLTFMSQASGTAGVRLLLAEPSARRTGLAKRRFAGEHSNRDHRGTLTAVSGPVSSSVL
jgi:hypothetical protein